MWWPWRQVRKADISQADRDRFERYGETVVALLLASELTENPETGTGIIKFGGLYQKVIVGVDAATAWLTERADQRERRENRVEAVEWAVLIFVAIGVVVDIALLLRH